LTIDLKDILALPFDDHTRPGDPLADPTATGVASTWLPMPACPFLNISEAASWLGVSVSTVKRLISRGELITVRIGARRKIPNTSLADYIAKDGVRLGEAITNNGPV
jgi:excisionase family DNA binding protein